MVNRERARVIHVANRIQLYVDGRLMALRLLSVDPYLRQLDKDEMRPRLLHARNLLGFLNVAVYDREGKLLADATGIQGPLVYDREKSFSQALTGQTVISHRITPGDITSAYVSLRVPIYTSNDQIGAVLAASIPLTDIGRLVSNQPLSHGQRIAVLDSNGEFIYADRLSELVPEGDRYRRYVRIFFSQPDGHVITEDLQQMKQLYVYREIAGTSWRVISAMPLTTVVAAVIRESGYDIAIFTLLLLCIGLIAGILRQSSRYQQTIEQVHTERLQAVSQFAAGVAHEIRNPLTAIKGFIQLIERKPDRPVPRDYLATIMTEIDRIDKLLTEFRLLARPMTVNHQAEVDLAVVLANVKLLMDSQAIMKQVNITCQTEPGCIVYGEVDQLKQVFINLLRNALEAVDEAGTIDITLTKSGNWACVKVADNGIGMTEETISQLGTPFFTTKESGTGLGLSVCNSIVHNHGGIVKVESAPGEGTVFTVLLPLRKPAQV